MKKKNESFVHTHVHSDFSQLDGCAKVSSYVAEAKRRGNPAIAMTEHGSMRGYLELHRQTEKHNIKPIYGIEFYVSPNMKRKGLTPDERAEVVKGLKRGEHRAALRAHEEKEGIRDRWHTTCWAMNQEGMANLQRLSSLAFIDGFYYKPRIDLDALCEYNEGLMVSTGCLGGVVYDCFLQGKKRFALEFADRLSETFEDRFFLEVQPHNIESQAKANRFALQLKDRTGALLLAGQDAHYLRPEDHKLHDLFLCIGTRARLDDPKRFRFDGTEFYFKTRREMWDSFLENHDFLGKRNIKEALDSTVVLAERCDVNIEIDYLKALLPNPGIPNKYESNEFAYLKDLCLQGWTWRAIPDAARRYAQKHDIGSSEALGIYIDRLKTELGTLRRLKIVSYFLIVHDVYRFVRDEGIFCGPGRGSAGGSLVAYLLGITSIDPVEYELLFERFINPDRLDIPDIDMDFEDARRREIIDYLIRKYGRDRVCQIATVGRLSGKSVLRDVSRVLGVPLSTVNAISPSIIERPDGHPRQYCTIEDSFDEFPPCRQFDRAYPDVRRYAVGLEGMSKTLGIHAAGVVASPVPLTDVIPLEIRKHKGEDIIVSAIDMNELSSIGLVKLDVLGLRTLTVIRDCLSAIHDRHGESIDMERIDMEDSKVLDAFSQQDFAGVFQYDTPSAYNICNGIRFEGFRDIAALTALNRPGATRSGLAEKYLVRKKNPDKRKDVDFHPVVSKICADTLGVIVYQEHCIKIFTELAGFAPGKADSLRKAIGKKKAEELKAARGEFVEGCKRCHEVEPELANKIFSAIEAFGQYGFNQAHSTGYAMIAYWCQYLKVHYPVEFYWALLKNEPDLTKIKMLAKEATKKGIRILDPHVSFSRDVFSIDVDGNIRGSLVDIKGVGVAAAQTVMSNQPFSSFIDFVQRIDRRKCNRGAVVAMIRAGALSGLIPNQKFFEANLSEMWSIMQRKRNKKELVRDFWRKSVKSDDYTNEERQLVAASVNPLAFGTHPLAAYQDFIDEHVKVPITKVVSDEFWSSMDGESVYTSGMIIESRTNQIGDYHAGDLPSKEERRLMFWGQRYSNVNIEDDGGLSYRVKFDIDIRERHHELIESGSGTPIIVHGLVDGRYQRLKAHFAIDLETYRSKIRNGSEMNLWERIVSGRHPAQSYPWKDAAAADVHRFNKFFLTSGPGGSGVFTGVITHVRRKFDKNENEMAFFGLLGETAYIDVVAFASVWCDCRDAIRSGRLMTIPLYKKSTRGQIGYFLTDGEVRVHKKFDE